jgi:hypothetical protein
MMKATYKQLVAVAVEYAENTGCSHNLAAKLYKVLESDMAALVAAYDDLKEAAARGY